MATCCWQRLGPSADRDVLHDRNFPSTCSSSWSGGLGPRSGTHRGREHLHIAAAGGRASWPGGVRRGREGLIRLPGRGGDHARAASSGTPRNLLLSQHPTTWAPSSRLLLVFLLLEPRARGRWYIPVAAGAGAHLGHHRRPGGAAGRGIVPLVLVCGARALLAVLCHRRSPGLPVVRACPWWLRVFLSFVAATARRAADQPPGRIPGPPR